MPIIEGQSLHAKCDLLVKNEGTDHLQIIKKSQQGLSVCRDGSAMCGFNSHHHHRHRGLPDPGLVGLSFPKKYSGMGCGLAQDASSFPNAGT